MADSYIGLNVGGKIFKTSRSTLNSSPNSFFALLLSGQVPSEKDKDGNYLINRDGKLFRYILNFLRCGKLALPKDFSEFEQLEMEADFYGLDSLKREIEKNMVIRFKVDDKIFPIMKEDVSMEPESLFADLFHRPNEIPTPTRDSFGNYELNRSQNFSMVWNFLKSGCKRIPETSYVSVQQEGYYSLKILPEHIKSINELQGGAGGSQYHCEQFYYIHLFYYDDDTCVVYSSSSKDSTGQQHCFLPSGIPMEKYSQEVQTACFKLDKHFAGSEETVTMKEWKIVSPREYTSNNDNVALLTGKSIQKVLRFPANLEELISYIKDRLPISYVQTSEVNIHCTKVKFRAYWPMTLQEAKQQYGQYVE